jgi:hypothetical protein
MGPRERPGWAEWLRRRPLGLFALGLLFVAATATGAYLHWLWWVPYDAIAIALIVGALTVVALVLAIPRRGRPIALAVGTIALGLTAGQLGPARPELLHSGGSMTVTLTAPRADRATVAVSCAMDGSATELQVSTDPNLRLDVLPDNPAAPPDLDQREFVSLNLTVGDRWRRVVRGDHLALDALVGRVEADAPETRLTAGPSSTLEIAFTAAGGSARFAGLEPDTQFEEATGEFIDLAGSLEWTCGS